MTDGYVSFALFLYENPQDVLLVGDQIGFSSGNISHQNLILELEALEEINVFRIDG